MRQYSAYGLIIRSEVALPELRPGDDRGQDADGDVVVRFGSVGLLPPRMDPSGFGFRAAAHEACHFVEKVGAFLVRGGREIVVEPVRGVDDRVLRLSILGPALALVLHQRGFLVLHASVVAHSDRAVAFLGRNGWGKSTIAAALHARGYDLVADDVAAIQFPPSGATVVPGFPQIKLWPDAVGLLGESLESLPVLHPGFDKRGWRAEGGFSSRPRRLDRVYVLAGGPSAAIEPLEPREACLQLLSHWYGHRFGPDLLQPDGAAATHLRQCVTLAGSVPVARLRRSSGGRSELLELATLVDEDLQRASVRGRSIAR